MSLMFKFSWEILFFESGDTKVFKAVRNKLFSSNEKQIDNHTIMLDMLHSYLSVVCTLLFIYSLKGDLNTQAKRNSFHQIETLRG